MCSRYWTLSNPSEEVPSRYRVRRVLDALAGLYPDARTALRFETPWQLLVATILSAQCTDVRVNIITEHLYFSPRASHGSRRCSSMELATTCAPA